MTREQQLEALENFFDDCVKFWERELNVSSDDSKEPYIRALNEIPNVYPYDPSGKSFDKEVIRDFHAIKFYDAYGVDEIIKERYNELYKEAMRRRHK